MAKEMMIVFIYDTAKCCKEDDDPAEAVMYFHPAWVSLTQKLALAGQLMGVHHFLATSFSAPRSITLQSGKFVLKKFGQYVLAVGTDRNIQDWILERRVDILESLLKFFHCDLTRVLESLNNDRNRFTEKLYQMFETYLPILQYNANLFSNIPLIKLPKSASNIFLEAIQMLQHFQETNGVLGGALFYNNKIVATQLDEDLTKLIVITDPYRIKAPAERIPTEFHLPLGVQLLQVYIEQEQFATLMEEANERYFYSHLDILTKKMHRKNTMSQKGSSVKELSISGPSGMKRDTSRIFTVPEESEDGETVNDCGDSMCTPSVSFASHDLPLLKRRKQQETKTTEFVKTAATSANPLTPSVCATPLKDVNRVLHDMAVLICGAPDDTDGEEKKECDYSDKNGCKKLSSSNENYDDIPDVVKEALKYKRLNKLRNATMKEKLIKKKEPARKSASLTDLTFLIDLSSIYSIYWPELSKTESECSEDFSADYKSDLSHRKPFITGSKKLRSRTITDPCYPIFRCNGLPVSQSLYEEHIVSLSDYELLDDDHSIRQYRDDELRDAQLPSNLPSNEVTSARLSTMDSDLALTGITHKAYTAEDGCSYVPNRTHQQSYNKRSMRLPLKPVSLTDNEDKGRNACSGSKSWTFTYVRTDGLDGLQLTPLMSKLSVIANEQQQHTYTKPYRDTTPSKIRMDSVCATSAAHVPAATATAATNCLTGQQLEHQMALVASPTITSNQDDEDETNDDPATIIGKNCRESEESRTSDLKQMELFLCGCQNMVVVLLMENGTANNPELIHALWQTCVDTLGKLETRLQQCLEPLPSTDNTELYSILSIDRQWDTIQKTGLWGIAELEIVSCLHDRFMSSRRYLKDARYLTDIIVRTEDTVIYGNQCGRIEVFYQQTVSPNSFGMLPTPADLMGIVALKAKGRLERDHGIVLL